MSSSWTLDAVEIYMVILDMGNSINSHVPVKNKQYGKFWLCLPPRVSYPMGRMLASCMLSGLLLQRQAMSPTKLIF